jgi:REP element-mobilizing transposase RayT
LKIAHAEIVPLLSGRGPPLYNRFLFVNTGILSTNSAATNRRLRGRISNMQFYRRNLPHLQCDGTPHFITFNTKFRRELPDWARDIALGCCVHDHEKRYILRVALVMPDHVHLILTPGTDETLRTVVSLVEIMKALKGASAHAINRRAGNHGAIWQEESFDRIVRSSESLDAKIAYILENPVRKGLVNDWREYRWIWRSPETNPYAAPTKDNAR